MCFKHLYIFRCKHSKIWWNQCPDATQEQRDSQEPCQPTDSASATESHKDRCCSVKCCQDDIDKRILDLEIAENAYGIEKGQNWSTRRIDRLPTSKKLRVYFRIAKERFSPCVNRHFGPCLDVLEDYCRINNEDHRRLKEPPYDPRPPRIPDRPEIGDAAKQGFLANVSEWKKSAGVIRDRELFMQYLQSEAEIFKRHLQPSGAWLTPSAFLNEHRLIEIYILFSGMLWQGQFSLQTGVLFRDLRALRDHFDAVQAVGPSTHLPELEFVMHARTYESFRTQLVDIQYMMDKEYSSSHISEAIYYQWGLELDVIGIRLNELITALEAWFEAQSWHVQKVVQRLQRNTEVYRNELNFYLTPQPNHAKGYQQPGISTSSRSSSMRAAEESRLPIFNEPRPIQAQQESGRSVEYPDRRRKRREDSTGSHSSVVSTRDKPSLRKKGREANGV